MEDISILWKWEKSASQSENMLSESIELSGMDHSTDEEPKSFHNGFNGPFLFPVKRLLENFSYLAIQVQPN